MKYLKYSDVALVPRYSTIASRSEIALGIDLPVYTKNTTPSDPSDPFLYKRFYKLPIIPANMKCVIDEQLAYWMSVNSYFYIMHRFGVDNLKFVKDAVAQNLPTISISVGVKPEDYVLVQKLGEQNLRVDYITVDIAHGHSKLMSKMLSWIKQHLPYTIIIAGNVATYDGVDYLTQHGADIVKVGIGQGAACTTKDKTGFTMPMFTCINNIFKQLNNQPAHAKRPLIIADGGIHSNGDIAKAIVAGADLVMAGGVFAQCSDSPAEDINGTKLYFGSASCENKGHSNHIEGKVTLMQTNRLTYEGKLQEITQDLQSAISYAGGNDLYALKTTDWIEV